MIFDKELSWANHIDYIVDKCKKRLNLMRSLTGSKWGANKHVLLTVYRALIRSVIDYGAIAYDSAINTAKETGFDTIQGIAYLLRKHDWNTFNRSAK